MRALLLLAALLPATAWASFLSGDTLDGVATFLAWFIVFVVPVAAVAIFLVIHVIPEKIAEHNHHPQQAAIKTLCFLSLVFGGLLWPLAWLWAFTKPTQYRAAYGTDRHENYFLEMGEKAKRGELSAAELEYLRAEIAEMTSRGPLPKALLGLPAIVAEAWDKAGLARPQAAQPEGSR